MYIDLNYLNNLNLNKIMEDEYPTKYTCPIMMDLMLNPVKASDGIIYEKNAIIDWYNKNGTSPYTREPLHNIFIEQSQLQEEIDSFISENNIKINHSRHESDVIICPICSSDLWNPNSLQLINCANCHKTFVKVKCRYCEQLHLIKPVINGYFDCVNCAERNNIKSYQQSNNLRTCTMF